MNRLISRRAANRSAAKTSGKRDSTFFILLCMLFKLTAIDSFNLALK